MKVNAIVNGLLDVVTESRFVVVPCGIRVTEEHAMHGSWNTAWGSAGAARFAESMGCGPVEIVYLDGRRESYGVTAERLQMSRVEVREVAPYLYAEGFGRVSEAATFQRIGA